VYLAKNKTDIISDASHVCKLNAMVRLNKVFSAQIIANGYSKIAAKAKAITKK
jgi:hypothetical protein